MIHPEKCGVLRATPRLIQILRVLARHKFLGALLGKKNWPRPKEVRETVEELGLTFIKFGQVLAMRRDLLPDAYRMHAELNITVDQGLSVEQGHDIACKVREELLDKLQFLSDVTIHVDPANASGENHHHIDEHAHDGEAIHSH